MKDDIQDMKAMWEQLNQRITSLEESNRRLVSDVITNRHKSSIDNLISRYQRFIFLELIFAFVIPVMLICNPLVVEKYRWWTIAYWMFFFLIEFGIDFYLLQKVRELDIYNQSVSEISSRAHHIWKLHKIFIMIGLPLAFVAVVLFALAMNANEFVLMGMGFGWIVGIVIGLRQLLRFRADFRSLSDN